MGTGWEVYGPQGSPPETVTIRTDTGKVVGTPQSPERGRRVRTHVFPVKITRDTFIEISWLP